MGDGNYENKCLFSECVCLCAYVQSGLHLVIAKKLVMD